MTPHELRERFQSIRLHRQAGHTAKHKPLLLLVALSRLGSGHRLLSYKELSPLLTKLLQQFGPKRKTIHPEHPFWRLQHDGIWEVQAKSELVTNGSGDVSPNALIAAEAAGGFTIRVYELLVSDTALISEIVHLLLNTHFPPEQQQAVASAVGLSPRN
jgi:putative restriction endonuclease